MTCGIRREIFTLQTLSGFASGNQAGTEESERHIAMKRMRILLQQKDTGLYFRDVGSWVPDGSEAMDFVSSTAAIDFCATNKLAGVQIVLKFSEEKCAIVMPVVATGPPRSHRAAHSR